MNNKSMDYFPMFIDITQKNILIVGAGEIAFRRMEVLYSFGASVLMIAPEIKGEVRNKKQEDSFHGKIQIKKRKFKDSDLTEHLDIVIAATDDSQLNERIHVMCKEKGILVNIASNRELCDFYFPAIAKNEDIVVGITGNGCNHQEVAKVARDIRTYLVESGGADK